MSLKSAAVLVAIICLYLSPTPGQAQPGAVRKLATGVYVWQGDRDQREPANCTWIVFKDYVVVIDANFPWGAREIIPRIKETTDKPIRFVLNTHYHADHSYGNSMFTDLGAVIINSEDTDREARTTGAEGWAKWSDPAHSLQGAHQEFATITFSDRLVLDDGTQRVEMIRLGPAHSKGDAVAYLPREKILATGDLCVTWGFGNNVADANANYAGWLAALDRMSGWAPGIVVPGHGAVAGPEALRAQRAYLAGMLQQVQDGLRAGKTADQLANELDLRKYGFIASSAPANATSVRAMYKHLAGGAP